MPVYLASRWRRRTRDPLGIPASTYCPRMPGPTPRRARPRPRLDHSVSRRTLARSSSSWAPSSWARPDTVEEMLRDLVARRLATSLRAPTFARWRSYHPSRRPTPGRSSRAPNGTVTSGGPNGHDRASPTHSCITERRIQARRGLRPAVAGCARRASRGSRRWRGG